jgi:hypothetical protein
MFSQNYFQVDDFVYWCINKLKGQNNIVNTLTQCNFYTTTRHIEKSDYLCQTLLSDIDENYSANMSFLVHFDRIKVILY